MTVSTPNNSLTDLMKFFSTPERPVEAKEMQLFWRSLTDEEKAYYKTQPLV